VRKAGAWAVSIERANHRSEWPETLRVNFDGLPTTQPSGRFRRKLSYGRPFAKILMVVGKDPSRISVPITRLSVPDTATDSFASKPRVFYKTFTALTIIWEL